MNGTIQRYWQHWADKIQDEDKQKNTQHNTTQRTNKMSNTDQTRKPGVESGACEW
jgi:hypothetical protein